MIEITLIILFSYISGSVPFGLILTKIFSKQDVRNIGSGNIGATNVLRTGNKYLAFLTLILDGLKGFVPVLITKFYYPEFYQLSALVAFLGHLFPVWLKLKGGKGVAIYLGILFAFSLQLSLLFIFTWMIVTLIFRYSSLSSMFSSLTVFAVLSLKETVSNAISTNLTNNEDYKLILFIFFILIIYTHRGNIINLKNKSEKKINI